MSSVHYCIWGVCKSWEYCCGDNVCCSETDFNSLLLTATILGTLIIVAIICTCFYCNSRRVYAPFIKKYLRISYSLMSTQKESNTTAAVNQESLAEGYVVQVEKTGDSL